MPSQVIPPTVALEMPSVPSDLRTHAAGPAPALGVPMLFNHHAFLKAIGVRDDRRTRLLTTAVGLHELLATVTILTMRHRRVGAFSRVAGDAMDLSLLASA